MDSQPRKPITIKFVVKGEVKEDTIRFVTESGEVLEYDKVRKNYVPSKKNQQRPMVTSQGKGILVPSEHYLRWVKEHHAMFDQWYLKLFNEGKVRVPIVRCDLKMLCYHADTKDRDSHNKFQTIVDMLVDSDILADDSDKVINNRIIKGVVYKDRPRTEVYITILEPGMPGYEYDKTTPAYHTKRNKKRAIQKRIQRASKLSKK
jgi:hypothetical protein